MPRSTVESRQRAAWARVGKQIADQEKRIVELEAALKELYSAVPFDVLRMQAGNAFLDMERVDNAKEAAAALLKKKMEKQ